VSTDYDVLLAERDELRSRARELAAQLAIVRAELAESRLPRQGAPPSRSDELPPLPAVPFSVQPVTRSRPVEPNEAELQALLRPGELLDNLRWGGPNEELGLPIPCDPRGIVDAGAPARVVVTAGANEIALRSTLCSVLDRAMGPLALSVVLDESADTSGIVGRLQEALPRVEMIRADQAPAGAHWLASGEELPWGWPAPVADAPTPEIAYLLPGLPPEGSGGSHSLVQEARGLRALGSKTHICVPAQAMSAASRLYGNEDELFAPYESESAIARAVGDATVVVATEYISVRPIEMSAEQLPGRLFAYYVQDYEPLFAAAGSARSDGALLSYRAIPGMLLFAKTHWLRNLVLARHGVPVAKVRPSLDQDLFHPRGREHQQIGPARVAAMVRPRTPRRRARATLEILAAIERAMGGSVQVIAFGCDAAEFEELRDEVDANIDQIAHLGLLTRAQVGELMRDVDVFIDASAYQAFGRTGLEAMACGAVPVLPAFGGVGEYAANDRDALVLASEDPHEVADAVCALLGDRPRLQRLRKAGLRSAAGFSIELAARSQLELFTAMLAQRSRSGTLRA
jgi:glycosyltransferase involved in cell wall biosynthesis